MSGGFLEAPVDVIRKAFEEKLFANLSIARLAAPCLHDGGSMVFTLGFGGGSAHNASGAGHFFNHGSLTQRDHAVDGGVTLVF